MYKFLTETLFNLLIFCINFFCLQYPTPPDPTQPYSFWYYLTWTLPVFFLPNTTEQCDDSLSLALEIMRHMNTWWLWLHFFFYHSSHLQRISYKHVNIYNILLWNTAMDHMAEIRIMPSNKYSTIILVQQLHHFYSESYSSMFIKALTPKNPVIPATKAKHSNFKSWNQDPNPKPQQVRNN